MSEYDENAVEFGRRLREMRKRRGFDQATLAEVARVPSSSISHFERGKRKPNFDTLIRLARGLDVSLDYLVGRTDYTKVYAISDDDPPPPILLTKEQVKDIEVYIEYLKLTGRYSEDWAPVVSDKKSD